MTNPAPLFIQAVEIAHPAFGTCRLSREVAMRHPAVTHMRLEVEDSLDVKMEISPWAPMEVQWQQRVADAMAAATDPDDLHLSDLISIALAG